MMRVIKAVCVEPVGCLAEFRPDEFHAIADRWFGGGGGGSGSEAYWHLLESMETSASALSSDDRRRLEDLELQAVAAAHLYEDVTPALAELHAMDVTVAIASSLSARAARHFLARFELADYFSSVWTRDNAGGVRVAPLAKAIAELGLDPQHVMALADSVDGMAVAKTVGANAILMFNDYDEGKRLAGHEPAGAIVSLHELPDAIRLVAEAAKR